MAGRGHKLPLPNRASRMREKMGWVSPNKRAGGVLKRGVKRKSDSEVWVKRSREGFGGGGETGDLNGKVRCF